PLENLRRDLVQDGDRALGHVGGRVAWAAVVPAEEDAAFEAGLREPSPELPPVGVSATPLLADQGGLGRRASFALLDRDDRPGSIQLNDRGVDGVVQRECPEDV